jgi:hypothetical protein
VTDNRVPTEVVDFLRDHIQTYEQLEVLVRVGRDPRLDHVIASLVMELNLDASAGAAVVSQLSEAGLLTIVPDAAGDRVRCHADAATIVARLAQVYESDRMELMSQMTQNAIDRVRTSALRTFSSAFVLGRKRDG